MIAYRNLYNIMEGSFDGCELRHIGRESNEEADTLANIGSLKLKVPPGVFLEKINKRSIKVKQPAAPSTPATGLQLQATTQLQQQNLQSKFSSSSLSGQRHSWHICSGKSFHRTQSKHDVSLAMPKHSQ